MASLVEAVALSDDVDGKPLLRCTHWFRRIRSLCVRAQPQTHPRECRVAASEAGAHTYVIALLKRLPRSPRIEWPHDSAGPAGTRRSKLIRISVVKDMAWKLDDGITNNRLTSRPLTGFDLRTVDSRLFPTWILVLDVVRSKEPLCVFGAGGLTTRPAASRRRPATPDRMRANGGTCASPREMPIRDGMIHAGEMPIRDDPAWEIKKKSV